MKFDYVMTKVPLRNKERSEEILADLGSKGYMIQYAVPWNQEIVVFFVKELEPVTKKAAVKKKKESKSEEAE